MKTLKNYALLCFTFLFAGIAMYLIYQEMHSLHENKQIYQELQNQYQVEEDTETIEKEIIPQNKDPGLTNYKIQIKKDLPKDCKGWIYLPDSNINYPIMQTTNNDYYLVHAPDNSENKYGSIFLDSQNTIDDSVLFIYGHNAKNKTMFNELKKYLSKDYYSSHQYFYLGFKTDESIITLKPYAICGGAIIQETDSIFHLNNDDITLTSYIKQNNILPNYFKDEIITDHTIFLITCHGPSGTDKRLILMLKEKV